MLKTISIAVAQLAVVFGGPIVLSYYFGWPSQDIQDVALYAFFGIALLGGFLGLPSVTRFIIGTMTPLLSMVLSVLVMLLAEWWRGPYAIDLFDKSTGMFIWLLTIIWILVPCGMWLIWGRPMKEQSPAG